MCSRLSLSKQTGLLDRIVARVLLRGCEAIRVRNWDEFVFNEWRREALKRSFYVDSDMQMCHSLTHSGVDTGMVGMATAQSEPDGILK